MTFVDDAAAAAGRYAQIDPTGSVQYDFQPNAQTVTALQVVWVRTRCENPEGTDPGGRQITVDMNSDPSVAWQVVCPTTSGPANNGGWFWTMVAPAGQGAATWDLSGGGSQSITFTAVDGTVHIDKIWVGPVGSAAPLGSGDAGFNVSTLTVQAESGVQTGTSWQQETSQGATAMTATSPGPAIPDFGDGTLTYTVNVPADATYRIWVRGMAPDGTSSSMHVRVNGGTAAAPLVIPAVEWRWTRLHDGWFGPPMDVQLNAGANTVEIQANHAGLSIDRLVLSTNIHHSPEIAKTTDIGLAWPAGGLNDFLTHDGHQYIAYVNADRYITIAHRELASGGWTQHTLTDPLAFADNREGFDTHSYLTLAVDDEDQLHLAGNMFASEMAYWRTSTKHDVSTMTPQPMPHAAPKNTYPVFVNGADGELFLTHRSRDGSVAATYVNRYDLTTDTWEGLDETGPVSGPGAPLLGSCGQPYSTPCTPDQYDYDWGIYHKIAFDGSRFHLTWMYRTQDYLGNIDVRASHDISYAWSPNMVDWYLAGESADVDEPQDWPMVYEGPNDPKVIDHLPPGTVNPADPLNIRFGGGLHNSYFDMHLPNPSEPIISYSFFDYDVTGQEIEGKVRRARHDGTEWIVLDHQPAGDGCQGLGGNGQPKRSVARELVTELDGSWSQAVGECTVFGGPPNYRVDPISLASTPRSYPVFGATPSSIDEIEYRPTNGEVCGAPGPTSPESDRIGVTSVASRGESVGTTDYILRQMRVPNENFGRPAWCPGDPLEPVMLRLYTVNH